MIFVNLFNIFATQLTKKTSSILSLFYAQAVHYSFYQYACLFIYKNQLL